jgi:S-adenosylmethionine synthetase
VARSASYYARYVAKNLVAAGAADRLELQVSYAIGRARPVNLTVQTFGTGKAPEENIVGMLENAGIFDFRPQAIINALDLLRPIYEQTAAYGHFGRTDIDLPWERLDKVDAIRQALKL